MTTEIVTYTSLAGVLKSKGESVSYNFFIESAEVDGYGEAILNGYYTDKGAGAPPLTVNYSEEYFFFSVDNPFTLITFGRTKTWELISTTNSAYISDPALTLALASSPLAPLTLATPEPSMLALSLIGLALIGFVRRSLRLI